MNASGRFVWHDLMTNDPEGAKKFYGELIGWKTSKWSGGDYEMWSAGEQMIGGIMSLPAEAKGAPPHWLGYVAVEGVDETVKKIEQLGGKVLNGPMDIPGGDRIAQCSDPQGGFFAIYSSGS